MASKGELKPESIRDCSPPTRNGEKKASKVSKYQRSLAPNSQQRVKDKEARNGEWKGELGTSMQPFLNPRCGTSMQQSRAFHLLSSLT